MDSLSLLKSFDDYFIDNNWNLEKIKENFGGEIPTILTRVLKARICSVDVVELLLKEGADINCEDDEGYSPLIIALTISNNEKVIRVLLEAGADVNKVCVNQTPLLYHLRSFNCSIGTLKLLLCYKAEVNAMDCYGQSSLTTALSHSRDIEIIRMLLEEGADVNLLDSSGKSPLCIAFRHSSNDIVKLLLDAGSSPNECKYHSSALFCVTDFSYSRRSREDILKLLLEAKVDVHSIGRDGQSVVCFALQHGAKAHDIQLLLDAGASLNTCLVHYSSLTCATDDIDCFIRLPLREDVVQLLLYNGVCVDDNSMHVLDNALCCNYETGAIQLLLDLPGMDAYVAANKSLLHYAVMNPNCRLEVVELLLNRRAQVHSVNKMGENPLHCAARNKRCEPKLINLLLKNGSPINAINKYGETPLMVAVQRHCDSNILKELLLAGAHIGKSKFGHGLQYKCELLDFLACKWETCSESKILDSYKMLLKFFLLQNPKFELKNFQSSCFANRNPKLINFLKECLSELEKMDLLQVVDGHTFRMFVSSDCRPVVKNYDIDQILIFLIENTFPVFIDVISARIGRSIMELAVKRLKVYTDKIHTMERVHLNCDVVFKISKYLSEDDLLKFILASDKPANKNDSGEAIKENSLPHKRNSESSAKLSKCRKLCS